MLIAEIHGKIVPEAQGSEDYLTSAVFGHLRYLPPSVFWEAFFACARSLPDRNGAEHCMAEVVLDRTGHRISEYAAVNVHFWPRDRHTLEEPDLLLCFTGSGLQPVVIVVEAKYWAGKSGVGRKTSLPAICGY